MRRGTQLQVAVLCALPSYVLDRHVVKEHERTQARRFGRERAAASGAQGQAESKAGSKSNKHRGSKMTKGPDDKKATTVAAARASLRGLS